MQGRGGHPKGLPSGRPEALVELDRCDELWNPCRARCGESPATAVVNDEVELFEEPLERDEAAGVHPGLPPQRVEAGGVARQGVPQPFTGHDLETRHDQTLHDPQGVLGPP